MIDPLHKNNGIAVDKSGNAYITGWTRNFDFPTEAAYDTSLHSFYDAFVAKLIYVPYTPPVALCHDYTAIGLIVLFCVIILFAIIGKVPSQ